MRNRKLRLLTAAATLLWTGHLAGQGQEPEDIGDFVRQIYVHGIPFEQASRYGAAAVPTLLNMLQDPEEQAHWSNIVIILGMIGDNSAVEPLIEFIDESEAVGTPSRSRERAEKSAVMSLGYIINRSGNQRALDYLTTRMTPPAPMDAMAAVTSLTETTDVTPQEKNLSKYAVLGLALSGNPRAAEALQSYQDQEPEPVESAWSSLRMMMGMSPSGAGAGDTLRSQVGEALRAHEEIAEQGLAEYYRESLP
ncbi:MAG: hypothetical protein LGR52_04010 [Candidatus Thiosymbion ectosymbiont of Robbea hypermnestra]|nr:hypothetical protein [Candidatus Thiosymbion ectosymbiont of Robbea hypermnestra]